MVKVTISIEGNQDEVNEYLQRFAGAQTQHGITGVSWLPEEIESLFDSITSDAQRVLREIANNPTGYDRDALTNQLGITGRSLAGTLSSVEFNRKRLFPSKPKPVELDWDTWKYVMLPEVAEWIISNPST